VTPEARARALIDRQLTDAGRHVQDRDKIHLFAGQGVAVREVVMKRDHGRVDYLLYVDKQAAERSPAQTRGSTSETIDSPPTLPLQVPAPRASRHVTSDEPTATRPAASAHPRLRRA